MTDRDVLTEAWERLSVNRLGTSAFREADKDLAAIQRLVDEVERLIAANAELVRRGLGAAEKRDAALAAIERVRKVNPDCDCPCCDGWWLGIERALDGGERDE
ncbi:hypothetical protein [Gordonia caeni]|uniref:Uncharacterized protein n=1 Tax=Gordonia caeni TaxID=1007097 RepID=A0ABP7PBG6_9ACTN